MDLIEKKTYTSLFRDKNALVLEVLDTTFISYKLRIEASPVHGLDLCYVLLSTDKTFGALLSKSPWICLPYSKGKRGQVELIIHEYDASTTKESEKERHEIDDTDEDTGGGFSPNTWF